MNTHAKYETNLQVIFFHFIEDSSQMICSIIVRTSKGVHTSSHWSRSHPYVNLIRQARVWGSPSTPWDGAATYDPKTAMA